MVRLRSDLAKLAGYVPGRQPRDSGWIKLNTNESPAVSPAVLNALRAAVDDSLRLYPDPLSSDLRERIAGWHGVDPDMVIVGNGSDDVLNMLLRVACDPGDRVVAATPSYSLYPVLAAIRGCDVVEIPLRDDFGLPVRRLAAARGKLTFVASPNNPAGTHYSEQDIRWLAGRVNLLVVDEAYVEFAGDDRMALVRELDNVCVTRSFSKAFGMAGLRLGYAVARPELIEAMLRVKDSYNVGRLAQIAGLAALDDLPWAEAHWRTIRRRRDDFAAGLRRQLGFQVYPSQANFVLMECGPLRADSVQQALEERRILVRRFADIPRIANALRVSIGREDELQALRSALADILAAPGGVGSDSHEEITSTAPS